LKLILKYTIASVIILAGVALVIMMTMPNEFAELIPALQANFAEFQQDLPAKMNGSESANNEAAMKIKKDQELEQANIEKEIEQQKAIYRETLHQQIQKQQQVSTLNEILRTIGTQIMDPKHSPDLNSTFIALSVAGDRFKSCQLSIPDAKIYTVPAPHTPEEADRKNEYDGSLFLKLQAHAVCEKTPDLAKGEYDFYGKLHIDCLNYNEFVQSRNLKDCLIKKNFAFQRLNCSLPGGKAFQIKWRTEAADKYEVPTETITIQDSGDNILPRFLLGEVTSGPCSGMKVYQRKWVPQNDHSCLNVSGGSKIHLWAEARSLDYCDPYGNYHQFITYLSDPKNDRFIVLGRSTDETTLKRELFADVFQSPDVEKSVVQDPQVWLTDSPSEEILRADESLEAKTFSVFLDPDSEALQNPAPPSELQFRGVTLTVQPKMVHTENIFPEKLKEASVLGKTNSFEILQIANQPKSFLIRWGAFYFEASGPGNLEKPIKNYVPVEFTEIDAKELEPLKPGEDLFVFKNKNHKVLKNLFLKTPETDTIYNQGVEDFLNYCKKEVSIEDIPECAKKNLPVKKAPTTYASFIKGQPVIFWKDPMGRWQKFYKNLQIPIIPNY